MVFPFKLIEFKIRYSSQDYTPPKIGSYPQGGAATSPHLAALTRHFRAAPRLLGALPPPLHQQPPPLQRNQTRFAQNLPKNFFFPIAKENDLLYNTYAALTSALIYVALNSLP